MKILILLGVVLLSGCAAQEQMRTGVVGEDGQIVWDEPTYAPSVALKLLQGLSDACTVAGAYYGGRAQGYQNWSQQHGTATVIVPGRGTGFIYY